MSDWTPEIPSDADDDIRHAMETKRPIPESAARLIASWWHGGQWSDLYSFTSTGTIKDGLLDEIAECYPDASVDDRKRLDYLTHYIRYTRNEAALADKLGPGED